MSLELIRVPAQNLALAASAAPGLPVAERDVPQGRTIFRLLDLPLYGRLRHDRPQLLVAAAGGGGWRRAELTASYDDGASWVAAGGTAAPAVVGRALTGLATGGAALIDSRASVEVELLNEGMWLEGRSDAALVGGANLAVIGRELIQFGHVEPLGGRRFRLSRLLRGRRGTEWAASLHVPQEDFAMLEEESLMLLEPPPAALGQNVRLLASGVGDDEDEPAAAAITLGGEALKPPPPVHLKARRLATGDLDVSWVRRSRSGWDWLSGADVPLGEENESYSVSFKGAGVRRAIIVGAPRCLYTAAQQASDGLAGQAIEVEVVQLGTFGASRATSTVVPAAEGES